jgi:hypothetical protein
MTHLEAASILLVGPTLKKFNDRGMSKHVSSVSLRFLIDCFCSQNYSCCTKSLMLLFNACHPILICIGGDKKLVPEKFLVSPALCFHEKIANIYYIFSNARKEVHF